MKAELLQQAAAHSLLSSPKKFSSQHCPDSFSFGTHALGEHLLLSICWWLFVLFLASPPGQNGESGLFRPGSFANASSSMVVTMLSAGRSGYGVTDRDRCCTDQGWREIELLQTTN